MIRITELMIMFGAVAIIVAYLGCVRHLLQKAEADATKNPT